MRATRAAASPELFMTLIVGCLMLQPMSTDVYLASLPSLVSYFRVDVARVQHTLSVFVIGFGLAQLLAGPLSDRYGRRPVLVVGVAIYCLSSQLCVAAPSLGWLLIGRLGQAVGCCAGVLVTRAIVRDCFEPVEGAQFFARASVLVAAAPLLGPILGSYLQVWFGWRAAFVFLSLFSLALFLLLWRHLRETHDQPDLHALRWSNLVRNYLSIARTPAFWAYCATGTLSFMGLFTFIAGSSFVFIEILGVPTQYYGFCFAGGVLGYISGAQACRHLLRRLGVARTLRYGATLSMLAGVVFLTLVLAGARHWAVVVGCQFFTMMSHGVNFPCAQSGAVAPFARNAGAAAGLFGFITMVGALSISMLLGATHDGTLFPLAAMAALAGTGTFLASRLTRRS